MGPYTLQELNDGCKHKHEPGSHQQPSTGDNARFVYKGGRGAKKRETKKKNICFDMKRQKQGVGLEEMWKNKYRKSQLCGCERGKDGVRSSHWFGY